MKTMQQKAKVRRRSAMCASVKILSMAMFYGFSRLKKRPVIVVSLAAALTACGGSGGGQPDNFDEQTPIDDTPIPIVEAAITIDDSVDFELAIGDIATRMPKNQTVAVSESLLAEKLTNAFEQALNSPGDNITLAFAGKVTIPLPLPLPVPPGLFFVGVDVARTMQTKFGISSETSEEYYEVTFEKDRGLELGAKVPALPKDTELKAGVTTSYSTQEVFRFNNPVEAVQGIMNYFLLQGVFRSMNTVNRLGIDGNNVLETIGNFTSHVTALTGFNFGLTAAQLDRLLEAELRLLAFRQQELAVAKAALNLNSSKLQTLQVVVDAAQNKLNSEQRIVDSKQGDYNRNNCNTITFKNAVICPKNIAALKAAKLTLLGANTALNLARKNFLLQQSIVSKAQDTLDKASAAVTLIENNIMGYQNALRMRPSDELVISVDDAIEEITAALDFLSLHHWATEIKVSQTLSAKAEVSVPPSAPADANADLLAGVNAEANARISRSIGFKLNNDDSIEVAIQTSGARAVKIEVSDASEFKRTNSVEYALKFIKNASGTPIYRLEDKGTFKIDADLSGALERGRDILNRSVGAGIKPIIEFKPGEGLSKFGENANDVIDLAPITNIISNFDKLEPGDGKLIEAAISTVRSFKIDQLIAAISERTLPLEIEFYRVAGIKSEIGNKFVKAEISAAWTEHADTLDLSDMTAADYVNSIFSGDSLTTKIENLVDVVQSAHNDADAIN